MERFTTFFKEFKDSEGERKYMPFIEVLRVINKPCYVLNVNILDVLLFDPHLFAFFKDPLFFSVAADHALRHLILMNTQEDDTQVKVFIVIFDFQALSHWLQAKSHPISAPENNTGGEN